MYTITEKIDGKFHGLCRYQGDTEEWIRPTRAEAVELMILSARVGNNETITDRDNAFYAEKVVDLPDSQVVLTVGVPPDSDSRQARMAAEFDRLRERYRQRCGDDGCAFEEYLSSKLHCPMPSPPIEDVGPAKYPWGFKGLLLWLADKL